MSLEIEDNEIDGTTAYVFSEDDLAEVPPDHLRLVGPEERAALRDPAAYFRSLAPKASLPGLRTWLKQLSAFDEWALELHTAPDCTGLETALFYFFYDDCSPGVRLFAGKPPSGLPSPLGEVYRLINGTNHHGFGMAGGLLEAGGIAPFPRTGMWIGKGNAVDPATCFPFYSTLSGDYLCYQPPGDALWYYHESGLLKDAGPLEALVDCYFQGLTQGIILEPAY